MDIHLSPTAAAATPHVALCLHISCNGLMLTLHHVLHIVQEFILKVIMNNVVGFHKMLRFPKHSEVGLSVSKMLSAPSHTSQTITQFQNRQVQPDKSTYRAIDGSNF